MKTGHKILIEVLAPASSSA